MALRKEGKSSTAASRRAGGSTLGKKGEEAASRKRGKEWVSIPDGESRVMRVFPETFEEVYVHRTPIEIEQGDGKKKKVVTKHFDIACLDQEEEGTPCPGCADDLDRRYKFYVWVILRGDADSDDAGEKKDRLALWSGGVKLFKQLNKKHKMKGLENRDILVAREGERFDTEYEVDWADEENVPLTTADKNLAKKIEPLDFYTAAPEFDDFYTPPSERAKDDDEDDDKEVGARSQRRGSPFAGERKSSTSKGSKSTGKTGLAALRQNKDKGADSRKSSGSTKKVIRRPSR